VGDRLTIDLDGHDVGACTREMKSEPTEPRVEVDGTHAT
jgi:hypothetical protein